MTATAERPWRARLWARARLLETIVLRRAALFLFVAALVSFYGQLDRKQSGDTFATVYTAVALVRDGGFSLERYRPLFVTRAGVHPYQLSEGADGRAYSRFPVAAALFAVPAAAVLTAAGVEPDRWDVWMEASMFTGAAVTAAAVALFFLLLTRVTTRRRALVVAAVLAWATPAWTIAGQGLWQHGPVLLALTGGLLALVDRRFALAGLALGSAVAIRPSTAVVAAALAALALGGLRPAARLAAGALPPLLALAAYDHVAFGCVTCTGYASTFDEGRGFTGVFWHGLTGSTVSPGRGIFVYSPVLLVALAGIALGWTRPLYRWTAVALVGHALVLAKWSEWWGGESFGPRLYTDALPLLCLLLVPAVDRWAGDARFRLGFGVLAAWSFLVQLLGAALWPGTGWYDRHDAFRFGTWWHVDDNDLTAFFSDPHRLLVRGGQMVLVLLAALLTALAAALLATRRGRLPAEERPALGA